jgi:8-oxo-dGTP pyrophosphatase MutT (NUDIX family)
METSKNQFLILAGGGIVIREHENKLRVLIVHRNRYNDYSLPKGKVQQKESFEEAAIREVFEETGFKVIIAGVAGVHSRWVDTKMKITVFFTMELSDHKQYAINSNNDNEVKEILWLSIEELEKYISYPEQTALIQTTLRPKL